MTTVHVDLSFDHVVTINGSRWPARLQPDGMLIDLRTLKQCGAHEYNPAKLLEIGIPDFMVTAAGESEPRGFVLYQTAVHS